MGLINWKSKPEDLIKTVEEEFERARHWLKKSTSSKAVREQISRLAYNASITGEVQRLPNVVEYTSKAGNRWLCLITVDKDYNIFEGLMMYGLTESYMWSITLPSHNGGWIVGKGKTEAVVFTPHFFQRLYERVGIENDDRIMALRNFAMVARTMVVRFSEGKSRDEVLGKITGCICYGHRKGNVVYFNTVIPDNQLSLANIIRTKGFRAMSKNYKSLWPIVNDAFEQDYPVRWLMSKVKKFDIDSKSGKLLALIVGFELISMRLLLEYSHKVHYNADFDSNAFSNVLSDMVQDFYDNDTEPSYANVQHWLIEMLRANCSEINSTAMAEALAEIRRIGGEGKLDFDKFHVGNSPLSNSLRKRRFI